MPELPEVETVARTLAPHVTGQKIISAQLLRPSTLHPLSLPISSLLGRSIESVSRRGKLLVLRLVPLPSSEAPTCLIAHLRMTGRFLIRSASAERDKHTRCILGLEKHGGHETQLFFDDVRAFGKLLVATPKILEEWKFWRELGPEPFDIEPDSFLESLNRKMAIKACLLDQRIIAGVGNIYADEGLHLARVRPDRPGNSLGIDEATRLLNALRSVLRIAIEYGGSSIRDYIDADGNSGSFQTRFSVYGRGGKPCKNCGALLQKTRIGGRATVFCPVCQI